MALPETLGNVARTAWRSLCLVAHVERLARVLPRPGSRLRTASLAVALTVSLAAGCGAAADDRSNHTDSATDRAAVATRARASSDSGDTTVTQVHRSVDGAVGRSGGPAAGASIGFRSAQRLDEHYARHGTEFGSITRDEYLRQAQSLRDAPVGGSVLEIQRGDGSLSRFDRGSGAFVAFDRDGTIRTFFRPNDGEAYFRRQALRRRNP